MLIANPEKSNFDPKRHLFQETGALIAAKNNNIDDGKAAQATDKSKNAADINKKQF